VTAVLPGFCAGHSTSNFQAPRLSKRQGVDGPVKIGRHNRYPDLPMNRRQHRGQTAGASQRQLRVAELIRHEMADMLARGEVHDPVIERHMITVPEVRVTADLRLATIYVMPLGGRDEKEVLGALDRNSRYVRGEIARRVNLKFAPEIRFRIDERFDEAERIEKLLRTPAVQRDLRSRNDK
jgi:ribosome-binding factor A